jgi:hypothetical protein
VHANKTLPAGKREIGIRLSIEEQKEILREKGFLPELQPAEVSA